MRSFALACAMVAAMVTISKADQPNQQTLSDMGLGSLVVMSDSDALVGSRHGLRPGEGLRLQLGVDFGQGRFGRFEELVFGDGQARGVGRGGFRSRHRD